MGRNMAIAIVDQSGKELAVQKITYGARLHVDDGDTVKRGTRLAQWDPFTRPIMTEVDGVIDFEDLVEGVSMNEQTDEVKGTTNRVIMDWRASPRGSELKPAILIKESKGGKTIKVARGVDARYLLSADAVLSVEPGQKVKAGDVLARIPIASTKSGDITGGLPRVAELFEARRPKDHAIIAEVSGTVEFGKDYKNKQRVTIKPDDESAAPIEYLIPRGKPLAVQHGDRIEKGDFVYDGHPAPHDILAIKGVEELANYLINEIQDVYRLQGVTINDKHIEVIVRQMLQKVEVEDPGDTDFLKGEQIDRIEYDEKNLEFEKLGKRPATAKPVLLGITKASLQTRSFISAASFQETTRVLTEAAVNGKVDTLEGLKENVIVGRLIPAGTGGMMTKLKHLAADRDKAILDSREKAAEWPPKTIVAPVEVVNQ
jgi:DNA-directed RNA polymerase subunit beta'